MPTSKKHSDSNKIVTQRWAFRNKSDFQLRIVSWYSSNSRSYPWRETKDPYKIIVAEITLKLTGAWKAEPVYRAIIKEYGDLEKLAKAELSSLTKLFQPLGLHSRAKNLIEIAKDINNRFEGKVPNNLEDLLSIKGIGQYTANAILCLGFGEKYPLVDGSVSRLFKRCFGYTTDKEAYADKVLWELAWELLPDKSFREYNLGLLDLGALICKHHKPIHEMCPLNDVCLFIVE